MNYDDIKAVLRDHGVGFGVPNDPIKNYSGPIEHVSDEEAVLRDHGVGFGVPYDPIRDYAGPIEHVSDEDAVRNDHGVGFGVPEDPMPKYGTRDQDLLNTVNALSHATWVADVKEMVGKLPDESVKQVVKRRICDSLDLITDRFGVSSNKEKIGEKLGLDLAIIAEIIREERNIKDFDTALYVGQTDERDVVGLIEKYEEALEECGVQIPMIDAKTGNQVIDPETNEPVYANDVVKDLKEAAMDAYGIEKTEARSK